MSMRRLLAFLAPPLFLAACGGEPAGSAWAGTVADSAGIPVVNNPSEGMWADGEAWTVVEELSIGSLEGDPAYQFGQIGGVEVDGDGNVYITDAQAQEIRVFDATGTYVRTIGAPGGGPGEFARGVSGVFLVGDELVVPDLGNARVSRFAPSGDFIASEQIDLAKGVPLRLDMASNGRLAAQYRNVNPADTLAEPTGDPIVTLALGGATPDTLGVLPPGQSLQIRGGQARIRQFEPEPIWDADTDGRLLTAMNSDWRFQLWAADGTLSRIITRPFQRKPFTDRDEQVFKEAMLDLFRQQGVPAEAAQNVLGQMQFADYYPAFVSLALGPLGSVWVQNFRTGDELVGAEGTFNIQDLGSTDWGVFDAEGRYLGVVTFPGKYQPIRAMGDRFYGIARDDLDVQSLKVYRVITDPGA
ncbi:MAG TPA: 6-bladed beta-propeller [Longimicrobiales bacterium]|nr:6-bladed beta-propeller [Longimicrobiales bacterium]